MQNIIHYIGYGVFALLYFAAMNGAVIFWPLSIFSKNKRISNFYRFTFYFQIGLSIIVCGIMIYRWYFTEKGAITDLMAPWLIGIFFLIVNSIALFVFGINKLLSIIRHKAH
jgi:hypothetical protein